MQIKKMVASLMTTLFGVFFLSFSAYAATVDYITYTVTDSTGIPIEGLSANLMDENGNYIDWGTTNSLGVVTHYSVTEGDYTIDLDPTNSWSCGTCGIYSATTKDITVSLSSAPYDDALAGTIQDFGTISLVAASRLVEVTLTDQNGDPVPNMWVSGWSENGGWANVQTNATGIAIFAVDADDTSQWSLSTWDDTNTYSSGWEDEITVAADGTTSVAMTVQKTDATIIASLKDQNGDPVTIAAGEWASVSCYDENYTNWFFGDIAEGTSTTNVKVIAGTYTCEAWADGYGASTASTTVGIGETANIDLNLLQHDATINVQLVDTNGNNITDVTSFELFANSVADPEGNEYYNDFTWGTGENGAGTISVLDGYTYEVGIWIGNLGSDGGDIGDGSEEDFVCDDCSEGEFGGLFIAASDTTYVQSYNTEEVVGDNTTAQTIQFTLEEADASIEVTLLDQNGDPEAYSWISAVEAGSNDWEGYVGASTDANGVGTLALQGDKTYEVFAYPSSAWDEGGNILPPSTELVYVAEGGTESITMKSQAADHTIVITPTIADGGSADFLFCFAYNEDTGIQNWGETNDGDVEIAWLSNSTAWVGCDAYGSNTYYRATDTKVSTGDSNGTTTVDLTLSEAGDFYEAESYSFDNSAGATTITLPDGESELIIPKGALDDGSGDNNGNVTLTVQSDIGLPSSDDDYNTGVNWEFTAKDSAGDDVTEFNQDLTIHMQYDEKMLEEMGIDENDISAAAYDSSTRAYSSTSSTNVDTETNTVSASISHFSTYSLLGDRGLSSDEISAPAKPKYKKMKVKKRKKKNVIVDWKNVTDATYYTVQVKKCKNVKKKKCRKTKKQFTKKKKWKKYKNVTKSQKKVKKLKKGTYYHWRVRACNSAGCSKFTKFKRFKTKGVRLIK